jgi:hypothetical protein
VELFGREAELIIGSRVIRISGDEPSLRVQFKVVKTNTQDPNTCDLTIYNLSKESRDAIAKRHIACVLKAGYRGNVHQIFAGDLTYGQSVLNGSDWITTLQCGDGAQALKKARVSKGLKGPISVTDALDHVVKSFEALGVGAGNARQATGAAKFQTGVALHGQASRQLDKLATKLGYEWSIQDGQLQLIKRGDTLAGQAIVLEPGTGLVGSPEQGEDGNLRVTSLLQPELVPGRQIRVHSAEVDGFYKVEKTTFTGNSWGAEWYATVEARPL